MKPPPKKHAAKVKRKTFAGSTATRRPFLIVGVGASAGGLEAFTRLLKHLPSDTGMGFVLVQHLDPQHDSALTQLLARATSMPVREVTEKLRVEPNHVYVIPPNTRMVIAKGVLQLQPREASGAHHSIDFFFESLAQDRGERAVGVVLSGTPTDGTRGLEAIKAEGGITFAQDESAKYDSMPRSAVAAGVVDFVLSPENTAKELTRIAKHPYVANIAGQSDPAPHSELERADDQGKGPEVPLASGGHGSPATEAKQAQAEVQTKSKRPLSGEDYFKRILLLLRNHCGVDFSLYKSATIQRRVTRRMILNRQNALEDYVSFLKGNAKELDALYSDVLISVTSFFRNPQAFEALKHSVFSKLLQQRRGDEPIRVWVLGCSTGQEAYSIAMSFAEVSENIVRAPKLQVFATDLNDTLLAKARRGLYAKTLVGDVSPKRLRQFFVEEDGGYCVVKPLRESVVFARQNLISDPPFSRIDLISCRNVMIYLEPGLQKKIIPTFHYALKPGGFLFLGASESAGSFTNLFEPVDKRQKIFSKKPALSEAVHLPWGGQRAEHPSPGIRPPSPHLIEKGDGEGFRAELNAQREADRLTVSEYAPPGVLINGELQISQFRGDTSPYLKPPTGKASFDLLKMALEELRLPLRAAINKAKRERKPVRKENVRFAANGGPESITIRVTPLKNLKDQCYLIFFEETLKAGRAADAAPGALAREQLKATAKTQRPVSKKAESRRVTQLEGELSETHDYLQSVQEQHDAANEELQASNEEVQSANEELQSINEELETSKEELESTNEELTTVNEEMVNRNTELNRLNSDLLNLQNSVHTSIVLLDRNMVIRRFTPLAEKTFNLLGTDVGRSINGVRVNFDFPELEDWITEVIRTVTVKEKEVQDKEGHWYSLRARPYMTLDNKIDGAVLMLVDIDVVKRAEKEAIDAKLYAEAVLEEAPPMLILREDLRVISGNPSFYKHFKVSPSETENRLVYDLGNRQWNIPKLRIFLEEIVPRNSFFKDFEVIHTFQDLGRRTMLLSARRLDHLQEILLFIDDTTERVESQERVRASERRYRQLFESASDGILVLDPDTRKITEANPAMASLLGYPRQEFVGKELWQIGLIEDAKANQKAFDELQKKGSIRYEDLPMQTKDERTIQVEFVSNFYREDDTPLIQCAIRDITERKEGENALRKAHARLGDQAGELERLVAERTAELSATNKQLEAFVYSIAHDLRAPLRAMQGFSALLVDEVGARMSESGRDYAKRINNSAQFMDTLLIELLAFSRISQQRVKLTDVNLGTVVASVLSRLQKEIQEKSARVENSGPWPAVLAHEPTVIQVLFNLTSNALKFVAPGQPPVVRVWTEQKGQFIRVWVEDNGIGIAPDHQEQIFRLFTRLHGEEYPGTGIGLAIVQKGVERMHGRMGLESTLGQGSRFWFELRRAQNN